MIFVTVLAVIAVTMFCGDVNAQRETLATCRGYEGNFYCGKECENRCNARRPQACDKGVYCTTYGCRCRDQYSRDPYTNLCVKPHDCTVDKCGYGELNAACGKFCEGTCQNPFEPKICQTIFCKNSDCRCDLAGGFVRSKSGQCVRMSDCPKFAN